MSVQISKQFDMDIEVDESSLIAFILGQINQALQKEDCQHKVESIDDLDGFEMYVSVPGGGDWSNMDLVVLSTAMTRSDHKLQIRAKGTI